MNQKSLLIFIRDFYNSNVLAPREQYWESLMKQTKVNENLWLKFVEAYDVFINEWVDERNAMDADHLLSYINIIDDEKAASKTMIDKIFKLKEEKRLYREDLIFKFNTTEGDGTYREKQQNHIIYKLDSMTNTISSIKYDFVIEFSIKNPDAGIYFGVKCYRLMGKEDWNTFKQNCALEWEKIKHPIITGLKKEKIIYDLDKIENPANRHPIDGIYWPFWIRCSNKDKNLRSAVDALVIMRECYAYYITYGRPFKYDNTAYKNNQLFNPWQQLENSMGHEKKELLKLFFHALVNVGALSEVQDIENKFVFEKDKFNRVELFQNCLKGYRSKFLNNKNKITRTDFALFLHYFIKSVIKVNANTEIYSYIDNIIEKPSDKKGLRFNETISKHEVDNKFKKTSEKDLEIEEYLYKPMTESVIKSLIDNHNNEYKKLIDFISTNLKVEHEL